MIISLVGALMIWAYLGQFYKNSWYLRGKTGMIHFLISIYMYLVGMSRGIYSCYWAIIIHNSQTLIGKLLLDIVGLFSKHSPTFGVFGCGLFAQTGEQTIGSLVPIPVQ